MNKVICYIIYYFIIGNIVFYKVHYLIFIFIYIYIYYISILVRLILYFL